MKRNSSPIYASPYRWFLLLTILIAVIAVFPIAQKAERQGQNPQGPRHQRLQASSQRTKKDVPNAVPGEILVRFRPESKGKRLGQQVVIEKTGRQIPLVVKSISPAFEIVDGLRVAQVNPADTSKAIDALRARSDVIYAEPNFVRKALVVPNDPRYSQMWGLNNTGQPSTFGGNPGTPGNDIRAELAWNTTIGNRSVVVGVVDTGIDVNHEDLRDNIWVNPGEIAGNGVDDDGNGFVDDVNGWDFAHNDATVFDYTEPTYPPSDNYLGDIDDHGTHVAGTIGANGNNSIGVAGVNWQVSMMSLKFLTEDAGGSSADLLKALAYAKAMKQLWQTSGGTKGANIRILNNSYGGSGSSQAELDAIRALSDAGILFVVAAGNEGVTNDLFPVYPANYLSPNVISVAASSGGNARAFFSNFGAATVNVTAPGEFILSTTPRNTYNPANGTSMAAPHVTGIAALVCAQVPNITMEKLRAVTMYGGHPAPWQFLDVLPLSTGRMVDASKALESVSSADVTAPGPVGNFIAQVPSFNMFPNYTLTWTAPGDDGNVGKVTAYELRFSETTLKLSNWDLSTPLPGPVPNDPGFFQSVKVQVPWRHPSGFIGVRAVDEVGNKGPIISVPISVSAGVGDPYTMSESAAAPVSTGGTALGLIGDDEFKRINLPFVFKFYESEYFAVTLSTNGTLYFGFEPDEDATSEERWLNGRTVIAGLWDDLRTDRRPGDDVYMVQDPERVIFRWQAVTFDTPIGPTTKRGENPVSFEIELRYDGTITLRYGDGNQKTLPVVGIGGGSPEPYISDSHTSERSLKDLTNAPAVVFARRNPIARPVLTVASSNPASGVDITVSPNDVAGSGSGTSQFTRSYNPGTKVTLTAPATVNGNKFLRWERDGQGFSPSLSTTVDMVANHNTTMTAVYFTPPVLTVNSSNPGSGVNIIVTPDINGAGNGTTPFTRTYDINATVNLIAPATVGTSTFWKWQVDGVDNTSGLTATFTMTAPHTATAIYIPAPTPTPTPTPVPGAGAQPIAFVKQSTNGADLFLANPDGTNVVNITDAAGDDTAPTWSPDGSRIAYTCMRQPDGSIAAPQRICVRNADGTGFNVLSKGFEEEFGPAWSRDGSKIAFTSGTSGSESRITIMSSDGTDRLPIFIFAGASNPDWSPDSSTIAFNLINAIWTYNRISQSGIRLTNSAGDSRPRYSPDGTKIVFQSNRDGQTEIYVMSLDGTAQTRFDK